MPDNKGVWRDLAVDANRAVAAAVFGDAEGDTERARFVPTTGRCRFNALQWSGDRGGGDRGGCDRGAVTGGL
jgi:hypothetical protein